MIPHLNLTSYHKAPRIVDDECQLQESLVAGPAGPKVAKLKTSLVRKQAYIDIMKEIRARAGRRLSRWTGREREREPDREREEEEPVSSESPRARGRQRR